MGVLDSDLALDVRQGFIDACLEEGDAAAATDLFLRLWASSLDDPEDGPVVWLALAAAQWDLGRFDARVAARARDLLAGPAGMSAFAGTELQAARARELARLARKLDKPAPTPKRLRRPRRVDTELEVGDLLLWRAPTANLLLWVFGINNQQTGNAPILELLHWAGTESPAAPAMLPAAQTGHDVSRVGHCNVWFFVLDLRRKKDPRGMYTVIETGFQRETFASSRASAQGLGASVVNRRGAGGVACLETTLAKWAVRLHDQLGPTGTADPAPPREPQP